MIDGVMAHKIKDIMTFLERQIQLKWGRQRELLSNCPGAAGCQGSTEVSTVYNTLYSMCKFLSLIVYLRDSKPRFPEKSQTPADSEGSHQSETLS